MTVEHLKESGLFCPVNIASSDTKVGGVYTGDLLSDIMAHAKKNDVLLTVMAHENTLAVASMLSISAVVLTEALCASDKLAETAHKHGINLFCTEKSTYEASLLLGSLLKGKNV